MDQGYVEREKRIQDRIEKIVYNDPIDQKKLNKTKAELSKLRMKKIKKREKY
ncbi:hypothetical protein [Enterococcus faecium]|uniref:hypothetical protein n=1 Tax=Enterococcus faecium TaxID=1352 RepID=UPI000A9849F8|nr:hypothetical protein [Enterococcus faecium]